MLSIDVVTTDGKSQLVYKACVRINFFFFEITMPFSKHLSAMRRCNIRRGRVHISHKKRG